MSSDSFGKFSDDMLNESNSVPSGETEVDLDEVMDTAFFAKYSTERRFENFSDWIKGGGLEPADDEGLESIPDEKMDEWVRQSTTLNDWNEMLEAGFRKLYSLD